MMRVGRGKSLQILSGDEEIFDHVSEPGPMWDEDGNRNIKVRVEFSNRFASAPVVNAGFSLLDVSKDNNLRVWLRLLNIDASGFDALVLSWDDTRLAKVRVAWIAIGEV